MNCPCFFQGNTPNSQTYPFSCTDSRIGLNLFALPERLLIRYSEEVCRTTTQKTKKMRMTGAGPRRGPQAPGNHQGHAVSDRTAHLSQLEACPHPGGAHRLRNDLSRALLGPKTKKQYRGLETWSACYRGPKPQKCPKWLGEGCKRFLDQLEKWSPEGVLHQ